MNFFVGFFVYIFMHVPMRFRFMRGRFMRVESWRIARRRLNIL
jgi:hypothetical protein